MFCRFLDLFPSLMVRLKSCPPSVIIFNFRFGCGRSFQRGTTVSEERDGLIEMARTIRMMPEQGNPMSRTARDPSTPLRAGYGAPAAQVCLRQHARSLDFA
jgi:hypothetical protein